jgi:hypothetical protein
MFSYHLRKVRYPRLAFVVALFAAFIWLGFRPGGTEMGDIFGLLGIARYWAVLAPPLAMTLVPMLGCVWQRDQLHANWRLAQASGPRMRLDRLLNFLAGYSVYAVLLLLCATYAATRLEPGAVSYANLAVITVVGPLAGGYAILLSGYLVGVVTGSVAARVVVVLVMGLLDVVNQLPAAVLSLSGTSLLVARTSAWDPRLAGDELAQLLVPSAAFGVGRLVLCLLLTLALIAVRGNAGQRPRVGISNQTALPSLVGREPQRLGS